VLRELRAASEPEALAAALTGIGMDFDRIGLEAGPMPRWLHAGLRAAGLPVVLLETRQLRAATRAMPVKTDRTDARAIAQMVRTGWFRAVHVKSELSQELRALLTARKVLVGKLRDIDNGICGLLRGFGLKVGTVGERAFPARTRELAADQARPRAIPATPSASASESGSRRRSAGPRLSPGCARPGTAAYPRSIGSSPSPWPPTT
jgi:transposase